jgi:hypothetical protein
MHGNNNKSGLTWYRERIETGCGYGDERVRLMLQTLRSVLSISGSTIRRWACTTEQALRLRLQHAISYVSFLKTKPNGSKQISWLREVIQNVEDWMGRLTVGGWDFYRRMISAISLQIRRWKGEHLYFLSAKWETCSYLASVGYSFVEKMKRKRQSINAFDLFRKWNQIQYSKLLMIINCQENLLMILRCFVYSISASVVCGCMLR